ncbi:hypothetical protein [Nocardioides flavescens]|uniref:Uncharacterized protein n=1 Tax=Nocardioides flavescens TaxID=2691959 RepID=A0A6L7F0I8_9ACTN|nr:hypothetical protein [Nocardioides flavescens]MXG90585.1 hypothetical protein [Nocardioides flavescens]
MLAHRPSIRWVVALLIAALLVAVGATATAAPAARLTQAKVKKIATKVATKVASKVVDQRAGTLSVARAASADTLAGAGPAAYLDRVASGVVRFDSAMPSGKTEILAPVSVTVPAGVSFVRVTATANFSGSGNIAIFVVPAATPCDLLANDTAYGRPYLQISNGLGQLVADTVVPVTAGTQSFHLCGSLDPGGNARMAYRTLVLETVASGAGGSATP